MSSIGGIGTPPPLGATKEAGKVQQKAHETKAEKAKATKETFGNTKAQVKLPVTSKNAMTQMKSKDQMALMRMSQEKNIGKLSENLKNAKGALKQKVLPRSIIGAGQSIPPASMRAMVAVRGSMYAGRAFEIDIGQEMSSLSFRIGGKSFNVSMPTRLKPFTKKQGEEDDEDEDLEEDL